MTRDEIADRIDAALGPDAGGHPTLADAVRALPVIATCGECGHLDHYLGTGPSFCAHTRAAGDERDQTYVAADDAPPSWCPWRGKR